MKALDHSQVIPIRARLKKRGLSVILKKGDQWEIVKAKVTGKTVPHRRFYRALSRDTTARDSVTREVKDLRNLAQQAGWHVEMTKGSHWKFIPPDPSKPIVFASGTSVSRSGIRNLRSDLRKSGLQVSHDPKKPSANERLIRKCQTIKFLPSQALSKVIGKKRVTKQDAIKKVFNYIKARKLSKGYSIRIDRRLKHLIRADKAPRYAIIEAVHKNLKP